MDKDLVSSVKDSYSDSISDAYQIQDKQERVQTLNQLKEKIVEDLVNEEEGSPKSSDLMDVFKKIEKTIVRSNLIKGEPRIDGRDLDTVRPVFVETDILPSAHGSALFTRGETQAIVVATLGSSRDAQRIESIEGQDTCLLYTSDAADE